MCIQIRSKVITRAELGMATQRPKVYCMTKATYLKTHLITQLMRTAKSMHIFVTIGNAMASGNYIASTFSVHNREWIECNKFHHS